MCSCDQYHDVSRMLHEQGSAAQWWKYVVHHSSCVCWKVCYQDGQSVSLVEDSLEGTGCLEDIETWDSEA